MEISDVVQKSLQKIQKQVDILKKVKFITHKSISDLFTIKEGYDYKLIESSNEILKNPIIINYKKLIKNIANCMEIHSTYYRNYKILK